MAPPHLVDSRLLIVDDEPTNVRLLERVLRADGYKAVTGTTDPREVLDLCLRESPDLLLLDLMMPYLDGYAIMEQLRSLEGSEYLPVLVLTADSAPEARERALSGGAKDFLTKPLDRPEILLRVRNLLETRYLHLQQQGQNQQLENRVRERTSALEHSQAEMLQRLAQAAEFRDDDTGQHTQRVGQMAARLAAGLGLEDERVAVIRRAAPLHDVGKIGVSDAILLKPGKLTPEEFAIMKTHAAIGASLLRDGSSDLVQVAETIARTHHERWDGAGYPNGLKGEDIPIEGRILSIVDVFDALTHERPYKKAWPIEDALVEIERNAGTQFDPRVTAAFVRMIRTDGAVVYRGV